MKLCTLVLLFATSCQGQTLEVKKKNMYTKPISVSFTISDPTKDDWIGIYKYSKGDDLNENPGHHDDLFWTYTCGTQEQTDDCEAISDGRVVFNGIDPTEQTDDHQWPILDGMYKVCHMREGEDADGNETSELLQSCKPFDVKMTEGFKKKVTKASVEPVKSTYIEGETVVVKFDAKNKVPNGWIAIYEKGENDPSEYIVTIYTGCNNVVGDQDGDGIVDEDKTNDCKMIKTKGQVTFNEDTLYRNGPEDDWPLPPGEYYLKIHYKYNSPYDLFKDSKKTFTVESNESEA